MYFDIGGLQIRTSFLVCRELAVHAILGCDFIQKYVEAILPQESKVVLRYGGAIAIQTKRPKVMANMFSPSPAHDHPSPRKRRVRSRTDRIKLAKPASIPPFSKKISKFRGGSGGLQRIEPAECLMRKHKLSVPYAVIDPMPGKLFSMKLASFSSKMVHLRKGSVVETALARSKFIVCFLAQSAAEKTKSTKPDGWESEVNLYHLDNGLRVRVLALMRKYSAVCDERLGTLKGATHRIEIVPGAKPVYQQPQSLRYRETEGRSRNPTKVGGWSHRPVQLRMGKSRHRGTKTGWSLRFCVDYRKLNSITVRDSYPMPRMDE